jgi:hypothetical protein
MYTSKRQHLLAEMTSDRLAATRNTKVHYDSPVTF